MGLSWDIYTGVYYGIQIGSFIIIYIFIPIFIPFDLIDWILHTIFFMKGIKKKIRSTQENIAAVANMDTETNVQTDMEENITARPAWCECNNIWDHFESFFKSERWQCCGCCTALSHMWNYLIKCYDGRCHCDIIAKTLENKRLPNKHEVDLQERNMYCGFMKLNLNKVGVYLLLCTCVWCAFIAFFESVILSYTPVGKGDNCPIPKRGTAATVDCFIYQYQFDRTPTNKTFPIQCNSTTPLVFSGDWAGCFALIYADVDVVDVIEELGICSGIIAFFGSSVSIISFLSKRHHWRLFFDTLVILAIAAIPILIQYEGNNPLLTYTLLLSLCISIMITEYLLGYVPLLTGLCLAIAVYKCIKSCVNSNTQSRVASSTENYHNSDA